MSYLTASGLKMIPDMSFIYNSHDKVFLRNYVMELSVAMVVASAKGRLPDMKNTMEPWVGYFLTVLL